MNVSAEAVDVPFPEIVVEPTGASTGAMSRELALSRLLLQVRGGDRHALNRLYRELRPLLQSVAFAVLRNTQDAEEVVNDVLLTIWQEANQFNADRGTILGWLRCICRNRAIDLYRLRHSHARTKTRFQELTLPNKQDVHDRHRSHAETRAAYRAFWALPESRAKLLRLIYLDGMTFEQAAQAQNLPLGTAKSTIRRCMQELQSQFRD